MSWYATGKNFEPCRTCNGRGTVEQEIEPEGGERMREAFGYGIVDAENRPHIDEVCIFGELADAQSEVDALNDGGEVPGYRAVELFWRELGGEG